jgi:HAD superfamily hydrolase (TIGR01509 family)
MAINYLLWDHDGVLVDTERWYYAATKAMLARVGVPLPEVLYLEYMAEGRSCWDLAKAAGASSATVQSLRGERDALYQHFLRTEPIEIQGVAETLDRLAARYRLAVVTTSRRADFELIHVTRDLTRRFEFVLTIEDYERCKPAPDPYLAAMARFGAAASEVAAIEDSSRGLRSALAAGCRCLVVRNTFTSAQDFSGAWRVVGSIGDLPAALAEMDDDAGRAHLKGESP